MSSMHCSRDRYGRSILHNYCHHRQIESARLLLEDKNKQEIFLNAQDNDGLTALHLATINGDEEMIKLLLEHGADVRLNDNEFRSVIHWATACGHSHLFDIFRQYNAPFHTADVHGAFPIHYASKFDSQRSSMVLKQILESAAPIDALDNQKRTALIWAASSGADDELRILYQNGANPNHVDKENLTALHCAATNGHCSSIKILLEEFHCAVEAEDLNGCTALFYAVTKKRNEAALLLLNNGANPNHRDRRGRTPSHCAISTSNLRSLIDLIEHGADIWMRNDRGDTPVHEAIRRSSLDKNLFHEIFRFDRKRIDCRNESGQTPLHLAASLGRIDFCEILIDLGARIHSFHRIHQGQYFTAYDVACLHHHRACAQFLLEHHGISSAKILLNVYLRKIQRFCRRYTKKKFDQQRCSVFSESAGLIVQSVNPESIWKKLTERCRLIENELFQIRQARLHRYYIVIHRPIYRILMENAFNPERRSSHEIENYLEKLLKSHREEIENIEQQNQGVPIRAQRRPSAWY